MYGVASVEDIWLIVQGYKQACQAEDFQEVAEFMAAFQRHVEREMNGSENNSWNRLILFHSGGALDSIRLFEDLYNGFMLAYDQRL